MWQISKCPNVRVLLTYREASAEVSELSFKSLLYFSSMDYTVSPLHGWFNCYSGFLGSILQVFSSWASDVIVDPSGRIATWMVIIMYHGKKMMYLLIRKLR